MLLCRYSFCFILRGNYFNLLYYSFIISTHVLFGLYLFLAGLSTCIERIFSPTPLLACSGHVQTISNGDCGSKREKKKVKLGQWFWCKFCRTTFNLISIWPRAYEPDLLYWMLYLLFVRCYGMLYLTAIPLCRRRHM